jgi:hypothetical protein
LKGVSIHFFPGEIMAFWHWLTAFAPHWPYVALALVLPVAIGVILALILTAIENIFAIKLGGGDV